MSKVKIKEIFEKIDPGYMNSFVMYNSMNGGAAEVVFVIKDFDYKVRRLADMPHANTRASIEDNGAASGLLNLVQFGNSKSNIYHSWFDKTIQLKELMLLANQKKLLYYFVNERNWVVDISAIPNSLNDIAYKYLHREDPIWNVSEFDTLIYETMRKHKSRAGLWNYITKNMVA